MITRTGDDDMMVITGMIEQLLGNEYSLIFLYPKRGYGEELTDQPINSFFMSTLHLQLLSCHELNLY